MRLWGSGGRGFILAHIFKDDGQTDGLTDMVRILQIRRWRESILSLSLLFSYCFGSCPFHHSPVSVCMVKAVNALGYNSPPSSAAHLHFRHILSLLTYLLYWFTLYGDPLYSRKGLSFSIRKKRYILYFRHIPGQMVVHQMDLACPITSLQQREVL